MNIVPTRCGAGPLTARSAVHLVCAAGLAISISGGGVDAGPTPSFDPIPVPIGAEPERWDSAWVSADGGMVAGGSQTLSGTGRGFRLDRSGVGPGVVTVWNAPTGFRRFSTLTASQDGGTVLGVCLGLTGSPSLQPLNGAAVWSQPGGVVRLAAPTGFDDATAAGSSDGVPPATVIAGSVRRFFPFTKHAVTWGNGGAGAPQLLASPIGGIESEAVWISRDARTVIGNVLLSGGGGERVVRWTDGVPAVIEGLPAWAESCTAAAVNADGSAIACVVREPAPGGGGGGGAVPSALYRWTQSAGLVEIVARTEEPEAERVQISANGSVLAATSAPDDPAAPARPLRWSVDTGLSDIGMEVIGGGGTDAGGAAVSVMSADGRTILGSSLGSPSGGASGALDGWYIWTDVGGLRSLIEVVAGLGVLPSGWDRLTTTAVNADGTVLAGEARQRLTDGTWVWRPVVVTLPPLCAGDFDGSRRVESDDIFAYLSAFFAGAARADLDSGGTVDSDDLLIFVERWIRGCD